MFNYQFMRNAFLVGGLMAAIIPLIGTIVVFKRMSMVGDSISHISLAGITMGLVLGYNPLLIAIVMSVLAAILLEMISRRFSQYKELSLSIILSLGVALTALLSSFVKNPGSYNQYLFGSVINIVSSDIVVALVLSLVIILVSYVFYRDFFYIAFDETAAQLAGVKVRSVSFLFTVLTAITIAVASKVLGALVISSLLVLPVASALQVARSYKQVMVYAIVYSLASMLIGLTASYYLNLVSGGTIVLTGIILLFITLVFKKKAL